MMDASYVEAVPMDPSEIYAKTELGLRELKERTLNLPLTLRSLLILIDGNCTVAQVLAKARALQARRACDDRAGARRTDRQALFGTVGVDLPGPSRAPLRSARRTKSSATCRRSTESWEQWWTEWWWLSKREQRRRMRSVTPNYCLRKLTRGLSEFF